MTTFSLGAVDCRRALDAGELTSQELVEALIARREAVDGRVNGFVHRFDEAAREEARRRDEERRRGEARGLLHGLPFTIKENLATRGLPQTLGAAALRGRVAEEDAVLVQLARQQGGIALGKSNVPLLLLAMETHNDLWGTTRNPWALDRTPGGSSGGEAALLASGQSVLGLGTDIGGSIRIPAAWSGVCGLKPTWGRWSLRGSAGGIPGQETVRACTGPMARSVEDLLLLWQALAAQHALDPRVPPLPYEDPGRTELRGLRVGFFFGDDVAQATAPLRRVLRRAAEALRSAGAVVEEVQPLPGWPMVQAWFGALSADGARTARARVGDQPPTEQLKTVFLLARLPALGRRLLAALLRARGEERVAAMIDALGEKRVQQLWALNAARTALQEAELAWWRQERLDLLLCPPTLSPAARLGQTGDWSLGAWPTMRFNLLDLPAGVLPVGRVRPDEAAPPVEGDRIDRRAAAFLQESAGLPLAVQVVGLPWREAQVLAAMAAIERELRADPEVPRAPVDPAPGPSPAAPMAGTAASR